MSEQKLALGPALSVEQIQRAKRYLQGTQTPDDCLHTVFAPIPDDPQERVAFLKIIDDLLAEVDS